MTISDWQTTAWKPDPASRGFVSHEVTMAFSCLIFLSQKVSYVKILENYKKFKFQYLEVKFLLEHCHAQLFKHCLQVFLYYNQSSTVTETKWTAKPRVCSICPLQKKLTQFWIKWKLRTVAGSIQMVTLLLGMQPK